MTGVSGICWLVAESGPMRVLFDLWTPVVIPPGAAPEPEVRGPDPAAYPLRVGAPGPDPSHQAWWGHAPGVPQSARLRLIADRVQTLSE